MVNANPTADPTNTYHVVVQASDGGTMEALNWFKVTVTVIDVEEDGKLDEWTVDADGDADTTPQTPDKLLQFQPGAILTVEEPTDGDGEVSDVEWRWYRSLSKYVGMDGNQQGEQQRPREHSRIHREGLSDR